MKISKAGKKDNSLFKRSRIVSILPQKKTMGIDIGSRNIKLAVVKGDKILGAVSEQIANGVVVDGVIEAPDILVKSLRSARRHLKVKAVRATLCLSGKDVIMREITLPQMKEDQVLTNIKNELSNIYLLASGDYTIDYRILSYYNNEETGERTMRVLVVSAPKSLIADYIKVCKRAGIRLNRIDVLPNAHTKLIRKIIKDQEKKESGVEDEENGLKTKKTGKLRKMKNSCAEKKAAKSARREAKKLAKLEEKQIAKEEKIEAIRVAEEAKAARLQAEKAAEEALKKKLKEEEERRERKKAEGKEISWYFGRQLNDLGENLYETNDKENAPLTQEAVAAETAYTPDTPDLSDTSGAFDVPDTSDVTDTSDTPVIHNEQTKAVSEDIRDDFNFVLPISTEEQNTEATAEVTEEEKRDTCLSDEDAYAILDDLVNNRLGDSEGSSEDTKNILENVCLIDIGFSMSNVTFIRNGSYSMHKNIRYGGEYINEAISEKMDLDMTSAESFKLSKNNDTEGTLYEYYDSIISELDNTMYYYKTNNNQNGVDCIVIAGGSSRLGGIREYFSEQLGVPVYMLSEIADFKISPKLIKRRKGQTLHFEDYLGAVSITLKEEWV
jgi:Tfp pilus assembly PilM family ATPase